MLLLRFSSLEGWVYGYGLLWLPPGTCEAVQTFHLSFTTHILVRISDYCRLCCSNKLTPRSQWFDRKAYFFLTCSHSLSVMGHMGPLFLALSLGDSGQWRLHHGDTTSCFSPEMTHRSLLMVHWVEVVTWAPPDSMGLGLGGGSWDF